MSTTQADGRTESTPRFCGDCGAALSGGQFCPACGHAVAHAAPPTGGRERWDAVATATTHEAPTQAQPVAPLPRRRRRKLPFVIAAAAFALAAGGAAAFFVLAGSSDDDADAAGLAYRKNVASTFGPVLGANERVSEALGRLSGTKPTAARMTVRRAQEVTTRATGAISALGVPAGSEQLDRDARQVLDRETAYLDAAAAVLANPSSSARTQLRTLSSNLVSAMSAAGPSVAGEAPTISGADRLESWALSTSRTLRRRAATKRRSGSTTGRSVATANSGGASPYANGRSCGGGLYAGPNTSCAFAENVRSEWRRSPGTQVSLSVFSPVTGTSYEMSCSRGAHAVECSGANDASVRF